MKSILVFGAGKSATCLIEYLLTVIDEQSWSLVVADGNLALAASKVGTHQRAKAVQVNVELEKERQSLVAEADIVISLLPPHLHILVARDCVALGKNLLTASYADDSMRQLEKDINAKGLLFLCEMGLDPGIDHMSAMKLIHDIRNRKGTISAFRSHCGGLVAPESDDNPWHYKISWNPRNVVQAGMAGASFRENGEIKKMAYQELFDPKRVVEVDNLGWLAWYPNRDSLSYIPLYHLEEAKTFVRTTLRYPEFCFGWKNVIDLKLTDETVAYNTDGMSLQQFFQQHFLKHGLSGWIDQQLTERFVKTKQLLEKLQELLKAEEGVDEAGRKELQDFMVIDADGTLMDINLSAVKTKAAATVAGQMHEANLSMKQLFFLGMDDDLTIINKGMCSALDVLQFAIEQKLLLKPGDKDMIVMLHELEYQIDGRLYKTDSCLVVKGKDALRTAMAQTVGLPLGIAAKLILSGKIKLVGLQIPVSPEIYEPVLAELENHGIVFTEKTTS